MRYSAFFMGVFAGVLALAGAIMGLGIANVGFPFGGGGIMSATAGVGMAMFLAVATIFLAVSVMFVRDARPVSIFIAVASIGALIAGGPYVLPGMVFGLVAATLAYRIDRSAEVTV